MKPIVTLAAGLAASVFIAGCAATDVVAKKAVESFETVAAASAARISFADGAWTLASAGGDEVRLSVDYTRPGAGDVEFSFDAAPFAAAGLDIAKLPAAGDVAYAEKDGRLVLRFELGSEALSMDAVKSMDKALAELVKAKRERVGYHAALDHYGIKVGGGHMFEWANDIGKNDKDIVWVLNPEPFIAAGLDPAKVEGWVFAKVETMNDEGKKAQVDRLLKPFDLE